MKDGNARACTVDEAKQCKEQGHDAAASAATPQPRSAVASLGQSPSRLAPRVRVLGSPVRVTRNDGACVRRVSSDATPSQCVRYPSLARSTGSRTERLAFVSSRCDATGGLLRRPAVCICAPRRDRTASLLVSHSLSQSDKCIYLHCCTAFRCHLRPTKSIDMFK